MSDCDEASSDDCIVKTFAHELAKPILLGFGNYLQVKVIKGQILVTIQQYLSPALGLVPARQGALLTIAEWDSFLVIGDSINVNVLQKDKESLEKTYSVSAELAVRLERTENVFQSRVVFIKNDASFAIGLKPLRAILSTAYLVNARIKSLKTSLKKKESSKRKRIIIETGTESD